MFELDLSRAGGSPEPLEERYSPPTLKKAHEAVERALVQRMQDGDGALVVTVRSLSGYTEYAVRLVVDESTGEILGAQCTCPSGQKNPRAICYHAAAVEMVT